MCSDEYFYTNFFFLINSGNSKPSVYNLSSDTPRRILDYTKFIFVNQVYNFFPNIHCAKYCLAIRNKKFVATCWKKMSHPPRRKQEDIFIYFNHFPHFFACEHTNFFSFKKSNYATPKKKKINFICSQINFVHGRLMEHNN